MNGIKKSFAILCFVFVFLSATACGSSDAPKQPEPTKQPINTYGFEKCWVGYTKRAKQYYLYNPTDGILITYIVSHSKPSKTYHVRYVDGDLTNGLYVVNDETGERTHRYFQYKNESSKSIRELYSNDPTYCEYFSNEDIERVLSLLIRNTDFTTTYSSYKASRPK